VKYIFKPVKKYIFMKQLFLCLLPAVLFSLGNTKPSPAASCRLQLIGLKCLVTEGDVFADAIYFKVDHGDYTEEWPKSRMSMSTGDYMDLRGVNSIVVDRSISFAMWDDDTFDPDDFLGKAIISCSDVGAGEKFASFTEDGAHYRLYYKVY